VTKRKKKKSSARTAVLLHFARVDRTRRQKVRGKEEWVNKPSAITDVVVIAPTMDMAVSKAVNEDYFGLKARGFQVVGTYNMLPIGEGLFGGMEVALPEFSAFEMTMWMFLVPKEDSDASESA
jgi:hypothetical protein